MRTSPGLYLTLILGGFFVFIGLAKPVWMGIGISYLLVSGSVYWARRADRDLHFSHGIGIMFASVSATALLEIIYQLRPWSPYATRFTSLVDPTLWEIVFQTIFIPTLTTSILVLAVATSLPQRLTIVAVDAGFIFYHSFISPVLQSMPYNQEGTITSLRDHLIYILVTGDFLDPVVMGVLTGLPLYYLVKGVPATLSSALRADS